MPQDPRPFVLSFFKSSSKHKRNRKRKRVRCVIDQAFWFEEFRRPKSRFLPQSAIPRSDIDELVDAREVVVERAFDLADSEESLQPSAPGAVILARRMASRFLAAWRFPAPPRPAAVRCGMRWGPSGTSWARRTSTASYLRMLPAPPRPVV